MQNEMLRCFKMVYPEETILERTFDEEREEMTITVSDGQYLIEYNGGDIIISFI